MLRALVCQIAVVAVLMLTTGVQGADFPRTTISFDKDWRFFKGDNAEAAGISFDDAAWQRLNVPHDWAIEGPFEANAATLNRGGYAPSGVAWYRKSFALPAADSAKRVLVTFDGVMQNSDVYINGFHLGKRPYGYVSFQYDLTGHVNFGEKANVLAVRTDTSQQPASRWYSGAGIYRHVRLTVTDPVHIENWATFITSPKVSKEAATVHLHTTVVNQSSAARNISLEFILQGVEGADVAPVRIPAKNIPAGQTVDFDQDIPVSNPKLWTLENPFLYQGVTRVLDGATALDQENTAFGIRQAEFKADTGFWLNGQNIKLKGVCLHHDAGGLGAAVPEDEWIHRLAALKEMGCNAVRTAHNPPSPEFLDACDKLGVLVMDEMFDCWEIGKNTFDYHVAFKEWSLIDTRDTVRRDRNHPSIILWSAGNEIREPSSRPDRAKEILADLLKVFHENDPTRPVTQAILRPNGDPPTNPPTGSFQNGFADMLDVLGTNYRDAELLAAHAEKPARKIVGTENNKDLNAWAAVRDHPEYSGSFIWTGVDYLGETFAFPAIGAGAGVIDITDARKPEGYQRTAWWSTKPVVFIARSVTATAPAFPTNGASPTDLNRGAGGGGDEAPVALPGGAAGGRGGAGRGARGAGGGAAPAGGGARGRGPTAALDWSPTAVQQETVQVYSNCDEVELFLNDQSLGTKPRGAIDSVRIWRVDFTPGTLRAVAKNGGKQVATQELKTAGKPARIQLTSSTATLFADFDSLAHITATITDDKGTPVPGLTTSITFTISGPGELAAIETAALVNQSFRGNSHATHNGSLTAFLRATDADASRAPQITLTASAPDLSNATLIFTANPARPNH